MAQPKKKPVNSGNKQEPVRRAGVVRSQLAGFVDFIRTKGVVGLAVGVVIGVTVNEVVQSLVRDLINPAIGLVLPADTLSQATVTVGDAVFGWGNFVSSLINLAVVAAVVYFGIVSTGLDKLDKKVEK